jgi:transposase
MKGKFSQTYGNIHSLSYNQNVNVDAIIKLMFEGLNSLEIAKILNCSHSLIYKRLKEFGINYGELKKEIKKSATFLAKSL